MESEFIITDKYPCANGWTPSELAKAVVVPLSKIGVRLIRSDFGSDGLEKGSLSDRDYIGKKQLAERIIAKILETAPPNQVDSAPLDDT
jgi:hypothetical protein